LKIYTFPPFTSPKWRNGFDPRESSTSQHRTVSGLLREAFRQYLSNRDLSMIRKEGKKVAKRKKLKEDDVEKIVRAGRK